MRKFLIDTDTASNDAVALIVAHCWADVKVVAVQRIPILCLVATNKILFPLPYINLFAVFQANQKSDLMPTKDLDLLLDADSVCCSCNQYDHRAW